MPVGSPNLSEETALELARELYGLSGRLRALPSERDQNFHLCTESGEELVLKIANGQERWEMLDCQNKAMGYLAGGAAGGLVPRVRPSLRGEEVVSVEDGGNRHLMRILTYLPGVILADLPTHEPALLDGLGHMLGVLDKGLEGFAHPATERELHWDIRHAATVIPRYAEHIRDPADRALVQRVVERFEEHVGPVISDLPQGVIHGDGNDWNVLVDRADPMGPRAVGIIDFGDMVRTCKVFELAVAAAYAILDKPDPLRAAATVASGYHRARTLTQGEMSVLFLSICARLAVSVAICASRESERPDNEYLAVSEESAWRALRVLDAVHPRLAEATFRQACGEEPCPANRALTSWLRDHRDEFGPVVEPPLDAANTLVFDLGVGSQELPGADGYDVEAFTDLLFGRLRALGKRVGVGQYDEVRRFYTNELFRPEGGESRTVHIGMDLFLEAGAAVLSPLDGTVHSFADNRTPGDYGPCIILRHDVAEGSLVFYTLYGHLSPESLEGLEVGATVRRGDRIARIGNFPRNGNWPPHLHFQIISQILGNRGDFPGVAPPSQREVWLSLCPDPNWILNIPAELFPRRGMSIEELLSARREILGPSLSLSYREPLKIVRGAGQYLYDHAGREYLDLVNNVCHVGHSHPRVVEAARGQMAVLNTNTRYLHDNLVLYARRLCATMPEPLSVCFLVCSGSEANELALRMARAHTGRVDVVVVEGGYHGNTSALVEISPYKFDGPGGGGVPEHVQVVPMPDGYRGVYRGGVSGVSGGSGGVSPGVSLGVRYGQEVQKACERSRARGSGRVSGSAAFLCESALGCGGQIILPDGYLQEAYRHARSAGAVCIADEVQVGFGRMGTHFWGFQTQGVVPDIVTMGKPMGNGHPVAGVVTTPEIAASFANGMEYFNSTGGNPVSCAVGLAVLDVIEDQNLQENARDVGGRLRAGLLQLAEKHPLIGDIRGLGLFLGIELVTDRETLEPATRQAAYIIERMKDRGILLSTDGPHNNVIKIKPPLVVTATDADRVVRELDRIVGELGIPRSPESSP